MANEARVRTNLVNGTLSVALLSTDTTMSSAGLANLAVITASNHAVIVCENEIMYVTAHTSSATTATILRGQEGTAAAAHAQNVAWIHAPVVSDFDSVLGYAQVTANQGSITTQVDLTNLTVTITVPYAAHRVRISAQALFQSTAADDTVQLFIMQDGAAVNVGQAVMRPANINNTCAVSAIIVPTAASHTYKLQAARGAGSGTITMAAAAANPAWILVEDLGPAL